MADNAIVVSAVPVDEDQAVLRPRYAKGVREMLLQSLDQLGGVSYLVRLAVREPKAYASLLAKCIPQAVEVSGDDGKPIAIYFPPV